MIIFSYFRVIFLNRQTQNISSEYVLISYIYNYNKKYIIETEFNETCIYFPLL